jgi:hypothetical protein
MRRKIILKPTDKFFLFFKKNVKSSPSVDYHDDGNLRGKYEELFEVQDIKKRIRQKS